MKTILVATDFSERSDRALRRAILLARQFDAAILLVHVVDDDQPRRIVDTERDEAWTLLRQISATLRDVDGVACESRVILASPFVGIAQAVTDAAPDLLVIGPHRRQVLRDVFVGTTAERTFRSVDCPILMANATPAGPYRHVLLTTDLSDGSRDALRRYRRSGLNEHARSSLLYLFDAPALRLVLGNTMPRQHRDHYLADERTDAARELSRFMASTGLGNARPIVRHDDAGVPHEILKAADAEKADLIVVATHGRDGLTTMLIGSVTEQVLGNALIDVLAIPPQPGE
ncbi:MAG: universal stress protein [Pseudomonadota bacterium]|nr:universal stress protein [Pseudomonadota bacterium]